MKVSGTEINGYRITFCVREHNGQPVQHLTLLPVGLIDYHGRWEQNYVNLEIRLVMLRSQIVIDEHMTVGSFLRLHQLLVGFQQGVGGSEVFGTADEHLELTVHWREDTQDVRFAGRIPAFDYTELEDDPLKLREAIYRMLSFQFALDSTSLTRSTNELANFIDLLRSVKLQRTTDNQGG